MLALFLACFVFTATVYYDYQEAHATSIVIGGVIWTVGEAFALLMVAVGVSATTAVTYQNRDALKAWGEEQIDSFCAWMAETDEVVWSAQQEVEQWTLSVVEGGLTTSGDMWKKFKKWISSIYVRSGNNDDYIIGPDYPYWEMESLSSLIGIPVYRGIYFPSYPNVVMSDSDWNYLSAYSNWFFLPYNSAGMGNLCNGSVTMVVNTVTKQFRFEMDDTGYYRSACYLTGSTGKITRYSLSDKYRDGNTAWHSFAQSNIDLVFLSPDIFVVIDNTPITDDDTNEYAYVGKIGELIERDGNLDNLNLINPGAAASDVVNINWENLSPETLPETLGGLATGDITLSDVLSQAGLAAVDALTGNIIEGDAEADLDIDNEGGIFSWLSNIIEWLKKIWNAILAIPASIASAIENVVVGQDDGNYKISNIVTDKFPFCIPFDLIHCFQVVQATPISPVWKIPFVIDNQYIQYNHEITIDFTDWERPVVVIRYFILLIYIAGLVYATRYVIKG